MSQRSAPLPAGHPVKALQGLSRAIALPHEYPPSRLPSFPALERTAVMGFSAPVSLTIPASTTVKVGTMRQAAYPAWAEQKSSGQCFYTATYRCNYVNGAGVTTTNATSLPVTLYSTYTTAQTASTDRLGVVGTNTDWQYPPAAVDAATGVLPWVYAPPKSTITYLAHGSATFSATNSVVATVVVESWLGPGEATQANVFNVTIASQTTGKAVTYTNTNGGWLRPKSVELSSPGFATADNVFVSIVVSNASTATYATSGTDAGTLTLAGQQNAYYFTPLVYPAEFANSMLPWQSTRTTAAASLFTNVTQVLAKGGTVLAGRVAPSAVPGSMWSVQQAYITNLHPAEKAYLGLETGHYTYVPPSTDLATFWDYTVTPQITASIPLVRLDNDALFNVAYLTASAVDAQLACTVDWHIEFRTTSTLFQIGLCTLTLETMHQAQVSLAAVGYFFENINHKEILNMITSYVRRYAPAALSMIPHPAAQVASRLLSRLPGPTPPTTSAAASGIEGPKRRARPVVRRSKKVRVARKGRK